ncbi:hypothetical protein RDABS01_003631, partial [Bienertia sinuspersici]
MRSNTYVYSTTFKNSSKGKKIQESQNEWKLKESIAYIISGLRSQSNKQSSCYESCHPPTRQRDFTKSGDGAGDISSESSVSSVGGAGGLGGIGAGAGADGAGAGDLDTGAGAGAGFKGAGAGADFEGAGAGAGFAGAGAGAVFAGAGAGAFFAGAGAGAGAFFVGAGVLTGGVVGVVGVEAGGVVKDCGGDEVGWVEASGVDKGCGGAEVDGGFEVVGAPGDALAGDIAGACAFASATTRKMMYSMQTRLKNEAEVGREGR